MTTQEKRLMTERNRMVAWITEQLWSQGGPINYATAADRAIMIMRGLPGKRDKIDLRFDAEAHLNAMLVSHDTERGISFNK